MKGKLLLAAGVGIGYVLGSRSGRESYEGLKRQAKDIWGSPTVQRQVSHAEQAVKDTVREQAPVVQHAVQENLTAAAKKVAAKATAGHVGGGTAGGAEADGTGI
jgi:hypothetical protein